MYAEEFTSGRNREETALADLSAKDLQTELEALDAKEYSKLFELEAELKRRMGMTEQGLMEVSQKKEFLAGEPGPAEPRKDSVFGNTEEELAERKMELIRKLEAVHAAIERFEGQSERKAV